MFDDLRLTELHEEWANSREQDVRRGLLALPYMTGGEGRSERIDAEIRRRVAAQEIGPPYLLFGLVYGDEQYSCLYGIPDAEREYPRRRIGLPPRPAEAAPFVVLPFAYWTNHERHVVPVEGCHLCQDAR